MPLILTEEQTMLQDAADGFLNERAPIAHLRQLRDSRDPDGVSRDLWRAFGEMGFAGVVIPEEDGGSGLGAVEAGASGYLLKDAPPHELITAVRAAAAGESALAPVIATRLMDRMRAPLASMSARELQVLELVAAGCSNSDIAAELFVSDTTVKSHLAHIFTKLGVSSRTAAVSRARERGILR